ncbi:tetracycline resistance MFS efflux pump [Compostibacter hankyongensis]|uniref:Tetracycline resistance MFS efflux pump n=2 Tax=Compostibacter hankyongensis TaxID=1007089 RepID=A0ABP8FPG9_9BACT
MLTVFLDLLGLGIVIPIAAPLLLTPGEGMLPPDYGTGARAIVLGFLLGIYSLAQFFGAPVLGALADRHGRRKILLLSLAGTAAGYLLFAEGIARQDILLCFFSRLLDGFTGGNISIAYAAIADITDEENRAKNFGLIGMSFGLGFILGPFIGGVLANPAIISWFNLATPYWFAAGLGVVNMFVLILFFPETLQQRKTRKVSLLTGMRNIRNAFAQKRLRAIFLTVFLVTFGFDFFTQFFQVFLIGKFSFSPTDIANLFGYIGLWLVLTQGLFMRPLNKRFSSESIVAWTILLLAIVFPFLLWPARSWWIYVIVPFIALFSGITTPNLTAIISMQVPSEEQGSILGMRQSMQALAMAGPPIIAGFITGININLPILSAAVCTVAGWIVFVTLFRKPKSPPGAGGY